MQPVQSEFNTLIEDTRFKPVSRIKVFPTAKTVPSLGFKVAFYDVANDSDMVVGDWWDESGVTLAYPISTGEIDDIIEPSSTIGFDWGVNGSPVPLSKGHLFAVRWQGFFFARYSGVYKFLLNTGKHSRLRIEFNNSYRTLKDPDDDSTVSNWTTPGIENGTKKELYAETSSLTAGNWYQIQIEFWSPEVKTPLSEPNFLSVLYEEPQNATTIYDEWGNSGGNVISDYESDYPIAKPLSAGVVNCSTPSGVRTSVTTGNVGFLVGSELTQVTRIVGEHSREEASQYSFDLPIPNATTLIDAVSANDTTINVESTDGFPSAGVAKIDGDIFTYTGKTLTTLTGVPSSGAMAVIDHDDSSVVSINGAGDYPFNPTSHSFGVIKAMRLCTIEIGYQDFETSPTNYYAHRIWGLVYPNPMVIRNMDGSDVLTVSVRDIRMLLTVDYFKNYPDFASYSLARYYRDSYLSEPDGIDRPVAYDRWSVQRAVRDILIKANIDPVLLYARQRKTVQGGANFAEDYSDYLIRSESQLDSNVKYGKPNATLEEDADDLYNWFFGYGSYFLDGISELAQNFLYQFGIQPDGKAVFSPINIPSKVYNDDSAEDNGINPSTIPLEVTSPNTLITLTRGNSHSITWDSDVSGTVKIELYRLGMSRVGDALWSRYRKDPIYGTIVASTTDDGTYSWSIPSALNILGNLDVPYKFKIKITDLNDTNNYDFSDVGFLID